VSDGLEDMPNPTRTSVIAWIALVAFILIILGDAYSLLIPAYWAAHGK
jgi:hypothetical protein